MRCRTARVLGWYRQSVNNDDNRSVGDNALEALGKEDTGMKIKRFFAADMRQAIQEVRAEQGPDAVILSNRRIDGGVELVAAIDYDASLINQTVSQRGDHHDRELATRAHDRNEAQVRRAKPPCAPAKAVENHRPLVDTNDDPALVGLRRELNGLRRTLDCQLSNVAWHDLSRREPVHTAILGELTRIGLSPHLASQLVSYVPAWMDRQRAWRFPLAVLAKKLPLAQHALLDRGGVVAMVGPTGVGKTTSIAKLAARFALRHGQRSVALVSTDGYRIGAQEQLFTFGRLLGVPVYVANDAAELHDVLERLEDKKLVLIDTAGVSQRDMRLPEQLRELTGERVRIETCLVLAANAEYANLDQVAKRYAPLRSQYCIATKLDETATLGGLLSVAVERQLPLAFVSDGQRVPEDLNKADGISLVCNAVEYIKSTPRKIDDEILAQRFGRQAVAYA